MTATKQGNIRRSRVLDILRAVAIFLVLGRHMDVCPPDLNRYLYNLTKTWNRGGWVGVDLFFVLSGFLISGLLFREHQKYGNISFKDFFTRRGFKIYPSFYVLVAVTVFVRLRRGSPVPLQDFLHEILFVQNYFVG